MLPHRVELERFQRAIARKDWSRALKHVDALLMNDSAMASLHYNRGLVLKHLDRPTEASAAFKAALQLEPNHSHATFEYALVLFDLGEFAEAEVGFRDYLKRQPKDADALVNHGRALIQLGLSAEARTSLKKAQQIRASTETKLALAVAERDCGDLAAMEHCLKGLDREDPALAAIMLKIKTQGAIGRFELAAGQVFRR